MGIDKRDLRQLIIYIIGPSGSHKKLFSWHSVMTLMILGNAGHIFELICLSQPAEMELMIRLLFHCPFYMNDRFYLTSLK